MSKKEVVKEQDLQNILDKISDDNKTEGLLLANELSFIIKTLDKLKDMINANGVVEDFKQGKQEFIRESTALKSYNTTMKTYNTTFTNLLKLVDASKPTDNTFKKGDYKITDNDVNELVKWYGDNRKMLINKYAKENNYKIEQFDEYFTDYDVLVYALDYFNKEHNTDINGLDLFDFDIWLRDDFKFEEV